MQKLIEKLHPNIRKALKNVFWVVAIFIVLSLVLDDLNAPDGGYLRFGLTFVLSLLESGRIHAVEISDTPLASLTIAKIGAFVFYVSIAILLYKGFCKILVWALDKL